MKSKLEESEEEETKVYEKPTFGVLGSLTSFADMRIVNPAQTVIFAFIVIVVIFLIGNTAERYMG